MLKKHARVRLTATGKKAEPLLPLTMTVTEDQQIPNVLLVCPDGEDVSRVMIRQYVELIPDTGAET